MRSTHRCEKCLEGKHQFCTHPDWQTNARFDCCCVSFVEPSE